ncbi:DUF2213 domain-containing protein [Lactobacillus intestinalis]|uniref:DUF2213 domain-containing protein n=1 Tax=Lactobacillus intestinalis TaxID=151781 RepID=UPI0026EC52C8|nr:DUF2213 domain-containing protein [Lactobacillus intestinalis]
MRYDSAPIKKLSVDPQTGYLHAKNVPIARIGVFPYKTADGQIAMEAKLPQDLLNDSTVESANSKPITNDHPNESVTINNSILYAKGLTANNAHVEGGKIKVDMTIMDADLIEAIQNGKQELSIGFHTDVVPTKGTFNGMAYDSVQSNIQINHVAIVDRGRAGHSVRLTGDSAEMIQDNFDKEKPMDYTKVRLDGADVTVASQDADRIMKLDADNADKDKKISDLNSKIKELTAERDKLQGKSDADKKNADEAQAKADSAEKELESYKKKYEGDALDEAIAKRMDLIEKVKTYVGDSFDFKGKSDRDMKIEAINSVYDSVDLVDKSDEYVNAYFDSISKRKPSVVGYQGKTQKTDSAEKPQLDRYHLAK